MVSDSRQSASRAVAKLDLALGVLFLLAALVSGMSPREPRISELSRALEFESREALRALYLTAIGLAWFGAAVAQRRRFRYRTLLQVSPLAVFGIMLLQFLWWWRWP